MKENHSGGSTSSGAPVPGGDYPHQDAQLTGTVTNEDGSPAVGVPVTVTRLQTNGEEAGDLLTVLATGGLACVFGSSACQPTDTVVDQRPSGSDGAYATTLAGAYVPGFQTDADWRVTATGADGASSTYEMEVNTAAPVAPPLALWSDHPSVTGSRFVQVVVAAPPVPAGGTAKEAANVFLDARGAAVVSTTAPGIDARLLEDVGVAIHGTRAVDVVATHPDGSTTYHQRLISAATPYQGTLVPLSRGTACGIAGAPAAAPCALTDGDLTTPAVVPDVAAPVGPATVDLGDAVDVGLVVAHGCAACTIETSEDGTAWSPGPPTDTHTAAGIGVVALERPVRARYVRVTDGAGLSELSVWAPDPKAAGHAGAGLVESDGDHQGGLDTGRVAAALVAVLLIGTIGGVALGRTALRRRR